MGMSQCLRCIYVLDFSVQAVLLDESKEQPCALLDGPESLVKVVACNEAARSAGVSIGMTKLQAEVCGVHLRNALQKMRLRLRRYCSIVPMDSRRG